MTKRRTFKSEFEAARAATIEDGHTAQTVFEMGLSRIMAIRDLGHIKPLTQYQDMLGMTAERAFSDITLPAEAARRELGVPDSVWKILFETQPYEVIINMLLTAQNNPQTVEEQVAEMASKASRLSFVKKSFEPTGPIRRMKAAKAIKAIREGR